MTFNDVFPAIPGPLTDSAPRASVSGSAYVPQYPQAAVSGLSFSASFLEIFPVQWLRIMKNSASFFSQSFMKHITHHDIRHYEYIKLIVVYRVRDFIYYIWFFITWFLKNCKFCEPRGKNIFNCKKLIWV